MTILHMKFKYESERNIEHSCGVEGTKRIEAEKRILH
jgi:hypothetical protein